MGILRVNETRALRADELRRIDAYWRAANYLAVGQIYLLDNPLLKTPLAPEHVKPRPLGHWGTSPGLSFIYVHLNRLIRQHDLNVLFVAGPGHGAPAVLANVYLEGSYSAHFPDVTRDEAGLRKLFRQFSFPGGVPSHTAPTTPGSIHEGGELGYSLSHAYGAALDNPDLIVACVVGDGEAETGPLAAAWHSNKFLNARTDGAVLPFLHLNGYKIANPTILSRIPHAELRQLLKGYGYSPIFVEGSNPRTMHGRMAAALADALRQIRHIQATARSGDSPHQHRWPMIVLRSPKGWTGPRLVDGKAVEGTWRSHQLPVDDVRGNAEHRQQLEAWLRSYRPEELFDERGSLVPELAALAPAADRRMGSSLHGNGGRLLRALNLPDPADNAVAVPAPGAVSASATGVLGAYLRDVFHRNAVARNFRLFSPDEAASNRLDAVFEATGRRWLSDQLPDDQHLTPDGRVMELLSEHTCQGWLEGYLLTGRHGLFATYEAFVHIVDSMFGQHAKWLKTAREVTWRMPVASLNYLLSSHVWRQDHNGFSHQDPGFIDLVVNKKADVVRVYLPPDANTLLEVASHCLASRNYVNVIVAGKHIQPQWLDAESAFRHCKAGVGVWRWASSDRDGEPDLVLACAGDVPTLEVLAATDILGRLAPDLRVRVVNVVDLMRLQPQEEHPHGLSDEEFERIFTEDKPILFAYHGYPWLIHRLTYRRRNHANLHVRGYKEEGTTTTPFDMAVRNDMDRFHLVADAAARVPALHDRRNKIDTFVRDKLAAHQSYILTHGEDMPEIRSWAWNSAHS